MKAGAAVGAAAVMVMSAGPALAEAHADIDTNSTSTSQFRPSPTRVTSPRKEEFTDAAAVVGRYWTNHFADYFGGSYTPPQLLGTSIGIPGIYDSDIDQVPCGQDILGDDDAYYCNLGDFIAAEDDFLHHQDVVGDSFVWFVAAQE
jgi:hypothetical protein